MFRSPRVPLPSEILFRTSEHLVAADTAGRAFAAGFIHAEPEIEFRDIDHAIIFVHDDHPARTHDGAELLQVLVIDRRIYLIRG